MSAPQPRLGPPEPRRTRRHGVAGARAPRTLRTLRLVRDAPPAAAGPRDVPGPLRRLVGLARVLTGGLLVLAVAVAVLPPLLGDRGPGVGAVLSHVVVALVALGATVVAAGRRTSTALAVLAALAVPVLTLVLLLGYWWA